MKTHPEVHPTSCHPTLNPRRAAAGLLLLSWLLGTELQAAIVSDFDGGIYPGAAGGGWVGGWAQTAGLNPAVDTVAPRDGRTPYLAVPAGGGVRNVARQYQSEGEVDVTLNRKADGYRGIWYMNQPSNDEYVY
ncbi:MAG: hypothetical protein FJ387_17245 [Verrucomicrobia bacterium]|nr:hypothetical protein [Verrucomicrobiota bacterium]